jgi:PAS domain S-box-containing protein
MDREAIARGDAQHAAELLELGDAFFELDRDWRIVRVNARQEALSRRPRSETVGRTFAEVWPELATPESRYWREYHRCMTERVPVQFHEHYAPLDLWTGVTAYPTSAGGIAVFFRDITRMMRAERERARVAAIVETTDDAIISKDLEGTVVTWNDGAERLFGYAANEIVGRPVTVLLPPDRRDEEDRILAELRAGRRVAPYDTKRVRRDGSVVEVSGARSAPPAAPPPLVGASKIARDITQRVRAERALRRSEEKFRSLFESAAVGVGRISLDGRFIEVNGAFADIVGCSRDELLARSLQDVTHPDDLASDVDRRAALIAGRIRSYREEKRCLRGDGGLAWVSMSVGLGHDHEGRPAYCTVVVEDVTERKRAEAALRETNERLRDADRRKDEFLGMLSHELRNPLAPIRNALYILEHAAPTGEQARRARDVVTRQVAHVTRLVDDLLDVTRIARGKIDLRREDLDLAVVARRTADDYRAVMADRALDLEVDVPDGHVAVHGDATRLAQVFGNLLSNAAKFTPAGGRVVLCLRTSGDRAVVRVRDDGPGIAPEVLPTVFEPFTQGKQTLARSEGGLGLGLSLVRGIVALHGGDVAAESGRDGRGTTVTVTLPLADAARDARPATRVGDGEGDGGVSPHRRVLVVDDNRDAADTLAQLLELLGHTPVVAYDAPGGLARAAEALPDLVLCDIGLPGMDGYEFARRFRALSPDRDIRLVAVSGYAQPEDVAKATEAGFDAHVAKPPDPERLASLLGARSR